MKKVIRDLSDEKKPQKINRLATALLLSCLAHPFALAQTSPPATNPQTLAPAPLDLDPDAVVKEISQEPHAADAKADAITTTHDVFEQSLLDAQSHKKISGFVAGGVGVDSFPTQHGPRGDHFSCENTAAGINDNVSQNTQVSVYAFADNCTHR